jgi:hypothetical protein
MMIVDDSNQIKDLVGACEQKDANIHPHDRQRSSLQAGCMPFDASFMYQKESSDAQASMYSFCGAERHRVSSPTKLWL